MQRRIVRPRLMLWTVQRLLGAALAAPAPRRRIELIASPTERTTAATDVLLACQASAGCLMLYRMRQHDPWKAALWSAALGNLALGALLGAVAHGFSMSPALNRRIWQPLNLTLGLTIALFATGVISDLWGERAARRALPVLLVLAGGFFSFTLLRPGSFLAFVLYQSVGMLFALLAYSWLAARGKLSGAAWMAAGVLTTIIAASIQAGERASFRLIWEFDHNGTYHLVQMAALQLLLNGLRRSLRDTNGG